jgi:hypothetical protein
LTPQGRGRADGIQTVVALATSGFSESLIQRNPDGSLPPQAPELLAKMVPPMFAALQRTLAPLLAEEAGRLHEPAFVQVRGWWCFVPAVLFPICEAGMLIFVQFDCFCRCTDGAARCRRSPSAARA